MSAGFIFRFNWILIGINELIPYKRIKRFSSRRHSSLSLEDYLIFNHTVTVRNKKVSPLANTFAQEISLWTAHCW